MTSARITCCETQWVLKFYTSPKQISGYAPDGHCSHGHSIFGDVMAINDFGISTFYTMFCLQKLISIFKSLLKLLPDEKYNNYYDLTY